MTRSKKIFISTVILIFFAFCLFQPLAGYREDWPFSYFGMYKGRLSYDNTSRFDIDVVFPDGTKTSIFGFGVNFYYLTDVLDHYIKKAEDVHSEQVRNKLERFLSLDVVPVMKKHRQLEGAQALQVRYRHWDRFALDAKEKPNSDIIFVKLAL